MTSCSVFVQIVQSKDICRLVWTRNFPCKATNAFLSPNEYCNIPMSCFRRLFDLGLVDSRIFLVEFVNPELAF